MIKNEGSKNKIHVHLYPPPYNHCLLLRKRGGGVQMILWPFVPPPLPLVAHLYREGKTGYILTCNCPLTIVFNDYGGKGEYKWPYNYLYPHPHFICTTIHRRPKLVIFSLVPALLQSFVIKNRGGSTNGLMTICTPQPYLHYNKKETKTGTILTYTAALLHFF